MTPNDDSAELEIELEQAPAVELVERPDPADEEGRLLLKLGQPGGQQRVFMTYACLKQMLAHTQRNLNAEVGGILLGQIFRSDRGIVTVLAEAVAAARTEAGLGHVTFSHETWADLYQYLESLATDADIVGWYHTHPGFGVFFSNQDRFIQENFFGGPGQVGIVLDPVADSVLLFVSHQGETVACNGFWVTGAKEDMAAARQLVAKLTYTKQKTPPRSWLENWSQRLQGALGRKQPTEQPVAHDEEA